MKKKALIIDDNKEYIESIHDVLVANGYDVVTANSGEEGFRKAKAANPDLILLDVMMESDGAGLDTVRKLKEDPATGKIPVILATGILRPEYLLESAAPGEVFPNVVRVLEKPVSPETLIETLKTVSQKQK